MRQNRSLKTKPLIHPSALVETEEIGGGTRVWGWTHIQKDVVIGEDCNIGEHCFIEDGVRIGNRTVIKNGVCLWKGIMIGNGVFVGPGTIFTNEIYPRSGYPKEFPATRVEDGATIGAGAVILAGVTIGSYATIGAGAVVTKNVNPHLLAYGNPARKKGYCCICGLKIVFRNQRTKCRCDRVFKLQNGQVELLSQ